MRKLKRNSAQGGLNVIRDGIRVVEGGVDQLKGEVGRVCGGRLPSDRDDSASRSTSRGTNGECGNKRKSKNNGEKLGEHGREWEQGRGRQEGGTRTRVNLHVRENFSFNL